MDATSNGSVAKLVKAWESKNGDRSKRIAGLGLMAVSLAACGGSDEVVAPVEPVDPTPVVPTLTALQADIAEIFNGFIAATEAYEDAQVEAASSAALLAIAGKTSAPVDAAGAEANLDLVAKFLDGGSGTGLEDLSIWKGTTNLGTLKELIFDAPATFDGLVEKFSIVDPTTDLITAASRAAALEFRALVEAKVTILQADFNLAVTTSKLDLLGSNTATANQAKAIAAIESLAATLGKNYIEELYASTATATDAQKAAGVEAFAKQLLSVTLAVAGVTIASSADSAAALAAIVTSLGSDQSGELGAFGFKYSTVDGSIISIEASAVDFSAVLDAAAAAINTATQNTVDLETSVFGNIEATTGEAAFDAFAVSVFNKANVDAGLAVWNEIYEVVIDLADLQAASFAVLNAKAVALSAENPDLVIADDLADPGTVGNDVYLFSVDLSNDATITGFGEKGVDTLMIAGEYDFVSITKDQVARLGVDAVGSTSKLEAFVYQDATSGDVTIYFESNAFDGSVEGANVLTAVTLADVTFADLTLLVDGGVSILTSEAAALV